MKKLISILMVLCIVCSATTMSLAAVSESSSTLSPLAAVIYQAILDEKTTVDVSKYQVPVVAENGVYSSPMLAQAMQEATQMPMAFYVDTSYKFRVSGDKVRQVIMNFTMTTAEIQAALHLIEAEAAKALAVIEPGMSDLDKVLAIHDYFCTQFSYAAVVVSDANGLQYEVERDSIYYNMYGLFSQKRAVCEGYAIGFRYIMDLLGIPCTTCISTSMKHEWNIVTLDGVDYHLDVTYDDSIPDLLGRAGHTYFLKSDIWMMEEGKHTQWDTDTNCTSTCYDSDMFWEDTSSSMVYDDGDWIFYDNDSRQLNRYHTDTGTVSLWKDFSDIKWQMWGQPNRFYANGYTALAKCGSDLIYNSPTGIYRMQLNGENTELLEAPVVEGYLYGMALQNGVIRYAVEHEGNGPNYWFDVYDSQIKDLPAYYSALDAAIVKAETLVLTNYDADSFSVLTAALEAAKQIPRNLLVEDQVIVDAALDDLNDSMDQLIPLFANYDLLDQAIAEAQALQADLYTIESYTAVKSAVESALALDRNLPPDAQSQVDAAVAAICEAIDALEENINGATGSPSDSSLLGDLNRDFSLSVTDVVLLRKAILDSAFYEIGDLNGDGSLSVTDVVLLRKSILAPH